MSLNLTIIIEDQPSRACYVGTVRYTGPLVKLVEHLTNIAENSTSVSLDPGERRVYDMWENADGVLEWERRS